jgi:dTDP-4-amino-4,6-dideoxygalactose transaminase
LHPYYRDAYGLRAADFPVATAEWQRMISLPIFPTQSEAEIERVAAAVREVARRHARAVA